MGRGSASPCEVGWDSSLPCPPALERRQWGWGRHGLDPCIKSAWGHYRYLDSLYLSLSLLHSSFFFLPSPPLTRPVSPVWAVGSSAELTGFMESPGGLSLGLERPLGLRLKEFGASQSRRSFCPGVLSPPSYPARFSFPLCILQAAQPLRNPSEKLPRSPLCLSSDQVLRILAKKWEAAFTSQGSGGPEAPEGEESAGLGAMSSPPSQRPAPSAPCPIPSTPNLALWVCLPEMTAQGENQARLLFRRGWEHWPRRWGSPAWLSPLPCNGGLLWKRLEGPKATREVHESLGGKPCCTHWTHLLPDWSGLAWQTCFIWACPSARALVSENVCPPQVFHWARRFLQYRRVWSEGCWNNQIFLDVPQSPPSYLCECPYQPGLRTLYNNSLHFTKWKSDSTGLRIGPLLPLWGSGAVMSPFSPQCSWPRECPRWYAVSPLENYCGLFGSGWSYMEWVRLGDKGA